MTPAEIEQLRRMIAAALQPMQDEIDALKKTDKRHDERMSSHSGVQRDMVPLVRRSVSDARVETDNEVLSAFAVLHKKIDDYQLDMNAKLTFINDNTKTVPKQTAAATDASIDTKLAVKAAKKSSRNQTIATIISLVLVALLQYLAKG